MAQASKAKRRERRLRRQNTLYRMVFQAGNENEQLRRMLQLTQQHSLSVRATLYAILTQQGGFIESAFTRATIEQVQQSLQRLSIEIIPLETDPNTYNVQLVGTSRGETGESDNLHDSGTTPTETPTVAD